MDSQAPHPQSLLPKRALTPAPLIPLAPCADKMSAATKQAFAQTLDRAQKADQAAPKSPLDSRGEPMPQTGNPHTARRGSSSGQAGYQDDKPDDAPDALAVLAQGQAAAPVNQPSASTAPANIADMREDGALQRMAAAIAEIAKSGSQSKMTVDFGPMAGFSGSAIIGRDAAGAITIHLITPPQMAADTRFSAQLLDRLLRRKLNVSTVECLASDTLTAGAVARP
jgi:hypothetical protein